MLNVNEIATPAYVCDIETFRQNVTDFRDAVKKHYSNYHLGYSFKTNYHKAFRREILRLGEYAEIVSTKELGLAYISGFPNERIIYNGVIEDTFGKAMVAYGGGIVNIDNLDEFKNLLEYAKHERLYMKVGLRLNFDIGNGVVSRFGIDVNGEDFKWLLDKSNYEPYLTINAVHCHISQARSLEFFRRRVATMAKYAKMFNASFLDIGGNMFGRMEESFKSQFPEYVPTFEEYAEVIGEEMKLHFPNEEVMLITEDGTPMVSNAMHLLATIIGIKKVGGNTFIVLDTKREDVGASCITKSPAYAHIGKKENVVSKATVFGCTCVEIDYLIREYNGFANTGDKILIKNIGAYSVNNTNGFITDGCSNFVDVHKKSQIDELIV